MRTLGCEIVCSVVVRYGSVEGSVGFLAGGIVLHYSPQAGYPGFCKRETTSPFCYTEADRVSSAIACRAAIFVLGFAPRPDAHYFTSTFGEGQTPSFSSRTVATVPLVSRTRGSSYLEDLSFSLWTRPFPCCLTHFQLTVQCVGADYYRPCCG